MSDLDTIDRNIVRLLRLDGRMSNARLAEEVGLSQSACLRRVQLLEERGTIQGYTAIVAGPNEAEAMVAIVRITLDRQSEEFLDRFEAAVRRHPEIRECYLMTGDADYILRLEARNAADYEIVHKEILSRLPGVSRIHSSIAIRSVLSSVRRRR
ncbi:MULTISPECIES: Lrp/AsnC family transcriptional regulator [unclassified Aureimonas]|uniref:Lrp/AsnC family transcriptional regulator n=1 Tax=unclassified Aureimonas TaxID=2615206 RepID=UPI0006F29A0E|nr:MULTISPECIES: Lrp/AsnC family transcriptional regulator [unclassified Aureimonas]KQT52763.1 hypothetical protein ASG62_12585 [Aureimonas sp. Leaf427]KQT80222.1 hypothetical protein ASG54_06435 [Aureimonas sp. Leaf460]